MCTALLCHSTSLLSLPATPAPAPCPLPQVYSFSKELKGKFSDGDFNLTVRLCRHRHPRQTLQKQMLSSASPSRHGEISPPRFCFPFSCPQVLYNTSTYYDDLAWGAGWLYKATKQVGREPPEGWRAGMGGRRRGKLRGDLVAWQARHALHPLLRLSTCDTSAPLLPHPHRTRTCRTCTSFT